MQWRASVRFARLIVMVFVVLQIADGLMTLGAVHIFGTAAEGNPILQTWFRLTGPLLTLCVAKGIACGGAALLYVMGRRRTLSALTVLHAWYTVIPWLTVLAKIR